ncbi:MAG: hypothetical protein K1X79_00585 [Oligoflexia bacterium]|nr:hypothetical protein [Oligoflexia bacterium]
MLPPITILLSFIASVLCTWAVRGLARRYGILAAPRADRWHRKPTALLGGIGIWVAFISTISISPNLSIISNPVIIAASVLFLVGLVDDFIRLKPYSKLVFQVAAAAYVVANEQTLPWTNIEVVNQFITIFWLVGITNAINLLDNMDGLAGGISAIAALFLGINFMLSGQVQEVSYAAALMGAAGGFLLFNRKPASIFMGDCGALFLGFLLGGMSLWSDYGRTRNILAVLATPVMIFLIPIFDTSFVTLTRKLSGRPVSQGGRDHVSHRLVALGITEKNAVEMLYLFALVSGTFTLVLRFIAPEISLFAIPAFALAVVLLGIYLGEVRVYDPNELARNGFLKLILDFSYKRRVVEVMIDALVIPLAYYAAYLLRWDGVIPAQQFEIFVHTVPAVVAMKLCLFLLGGLYGGVWRYASIGDMVQITKIAVGSSIVTAITILAMYGFVGPSRGVFILDAILLLLMTAGTRISFRVFREMFQQSTQEVDPSKRPLIIYGAGDEAELLLRDLQGGVIPDYSAVALIDTEHRCSGRRVRGYPVYSVEDAPKLAANYGNSDVVVATRSPNEADLERLKGYGFALRKLSIKIE